MLKHPEIARAIRVGGLVHGHRWAEGNAGNMSVRMEGGMRLPRPAGRRTEFPLAAAFPKLAGAKFLVTATGQRMRDLERSPEDGLLLVEILEGGAGYRRLWGTGRATSEFICHLAAHQVCAGRRPENRAVLHVHSPHLIVMSQLTALQRGGRFVDALERVHPEAGTLIGLYGLTLIPFMVGSTPELARATGRALETSQLAMWSMHGLVSSAPGLEAALDRAEMAERAAELYLLRLMADPRARGLSNAQLAAVRKVYCPGKS